MAIWTSESGGLPDQELRRLLALELQVLLALELQDRLHSGKDKSRRKQERRLWDGQRHLDRMKRNSLD